MKTSTTSTSVALAAPAKPAKASKPTTKEDRRTASKTVKGKKGGRATKAEAARLSDAITDAPPAREEREAAPPVAEMQTPQADTPGLGAPVLTEEDYASMPRVGFFHRLAASLLDFILLFWIIPATSFGWFVLAWLGYHVGMWLWKGTTVGGIICGIKIARLDGRQLDASIVVVRALAAVLSFVALGVGFFWAGWVPEKQSWHDKVAGTTIVKLPKGTSLV